MTLLRCFAFSVLAAVTLGAAAQTKWDLPAAYPATNFHSINLAEFASDVDKATGGKLKITVHPGASLFKATEIKRAVQGGQAQIGEVLISNFSNEWPLFGADAIPFFADSFFAAGLAAVAFADVAAIGVANKSRSDWTLSRQMTWSPSRATRCSPKASPSTDCRSCSNGRTPVRWISNNSTSTTRIA